jgi:hypothetical protein
MKIKKILSITLIGLFLSSNLSYPQDTSYLRVPILDMQRLKELLPSATSLSPTIPKLPEPIYTSEDGWKLIDIEAHEVGLSNGDPTVEMVFILERRDGIHTGKRRQTRET